MIYQADTDWYFLSLHKKGAYLTHVKVYLDEFVGFIQKVLYERRQIIRQLFNSVDKLFRTNNLLNVVQEELISYKKDQRDTQSGSPGNISWDGQYTQLSRCSPYLRPGGIK